MLTTNIASSCISLTYTTPTQYTNGTKTWSLCYEPGQPTPSPTVSPTRSPTYVGGNPTPVPSAAPTGNIILLLVASSL